jgi:hypothetical protein
MKSFKEYLFEQIDDLKVVDLATAKWKSPLGKTGFAKRSGVWGIQRKDGKVLAKNNDPVVWDKKNLVQTQILPYANDFKNHHWIEVDI